MNVRIIHVTAGCDVCDRSGKFHEYQCPVCFGTGEVKYDRWEEVKTKQTGLKLVYHPKHKELIVRDEHYIGRINGVESVKRSIGGHYPDRIMCSDANGDTIAILRGKFSILKGQ